MYGSCFNKVSLGFQIQRLGLTFYWSFGGNAVIWDTRFTKKVDFLEGSFLVFVLLDIKHR